MEKDKDSNNHEKDDAAGSKSSENRKSFRGNDKSESDSRQNNDEVTQSKSKPDVLAKFFSKDLDDSIESADEHVDENEENVENTNLSEEEVHEVTLAIVDGRTQEVAEELSAADPDSVEEFEALADAVFLESLQDLAENRADVTQEMIEQAYQESLEDLSLSSGDTTTSESDYSQPVQGEMQENQDDLNSPVNLPVIPRTTSYRTLTHPVAPNILSPNSQTAPPPTSNNSNTNQNLISGQYNYQNPQAVNQNTQPIIINEVHNHRNNLLLGAVIGYMIGRRGGRKRTEKKLLPEIDNLQKQVTTLYDAISEKELKIRNLARANLMNSEQKKVETGILVERRIKRKEVKEALRRREELSTKPGVEKIGKFSLPALKIFHERRLPDGTENSPKRVQVEAMTETELLEKVAGLSIHGLNVADSYRKKRLTLESLRQITKEYLRGGHFKQTFALELLPDEKEIINKRQQVHNAHSDIQPSQHWTRKEHEQQNVDSRNSKTSSADEQLHLSSVRDNTKSSIKSGIITGIVLAAITVVIYLIN